MGSRRRWSSATCRGRSAASRGSGRTRGRRPSSRTGSCVRCRRRRRRSAPRPRHEPHRPGATAVAAYAALDAGQLGAAVVEPMWPSAARCTSRRGRGRTSWPRAGRCGRSAWGRPCACGAERAWRARRGPAGSRAQMPARPWASGASRLGCGLGRVRLCRRRSLGLGRSLGRRRGLRGRRGRLRGGRRLRRRRGLGLRRRCGAGWAAGAGAAAAAFGPSAFLSADGGPAGPWAPGLASAWSAAPKAHSPPNRALSDLTGTRSMAVGLTADWSCTWPPP